MDGEVLKYYLNQKAIKINDLADKLEISRQTLSTWLKGNFNDVQKDQIIKALDLPKDFFSNTLAYDLRGQNVLPLRSGIDYKQKYFELLEEYKILSDKLTSYLESKMK